MIRAIGIDDEPHCLARLASVLADHCPTTVQLVGTAQSVEEGILAIQEHQPTLIFLDVQIHDKTGFDLLKRLQQTDYNKPTFEVIFTTAFERYAVQAFRFSAVDYLLKPIDPDDLIQAVSKLEKRVQTTDLSDRLDALLHNIHATQHTPKRIGVPVEKGLVFLQVSDIVRCQSNGNYTTIFLKDRQKLVVAKTLKEFEELLTDSNFFRIHNSHLINLAYLKSYNKGKGGSVIMIDNSEIEVSTRRKDDFLKKVVNR